jgi:hypothetical protein
MNLRYRKITTPIALLVALAIGQLYVGTGLAESNFVSRPSEVTPAPLMGILSTRDNKPITVNGASALTGATIPSGATIETPDQVGATIKLGVLGNICLGPNTKVVIEFDRQGKAGNVKITLIEGCVILRTQKDTAGLITSAQGTIGQTDAATGGSIDVCARAGSAPSINQGAAATAGAGASALDCGAAGAAAAPPTGIPLSATLAIITGGGTGLYLLFRGNNPSPSGL